MAIVDSSKVKSTSSRPCMSRGSIANEASEVIVIWKMRVITIYEEEREIIVTYVSTSGLQKQPNKAEKGQMNSQITETSY